ncbi:UNVERIFIED_ORG: hypothetical protein M2355_002060 [Lelliottia amnigena]|nr:hypothetical protein [Lelliottia amnigena]
MSYVTNATFNNIHMSYVLTRDDSSKILNWFLSSPEAQINLFSLIRAL